MPPFDFFYFFLLEFVLTLKVQLPKNHFFVSHARL